MQVILLERVAKLGQMGDVVKVKPGYARNFLLPRKKALRATKENLAYFETQRKRLETTNLERKQEAEQVAEKMKDFSVVLIRSASEALQLYGSVSARDIAQAATEAGVQIDRHQVNLDKALKALGLYSVDIVLHPEVSVPIKVNIARSAEEAEFQAKGGVLVAETERAQQELQEQLAAQQAAMLEKAKATADAAFKAEAAEGEAATAEAADAGAEEKGSKKKSAKDAAATDDDGEAKADKKKKKK
jgi:large subunit ribosomal protein L9